MKEPLCRFCHEPLEVSFIDLGMSPLSNSYVRPDQIRGKENFYPLHTYVCKSCFLVQLEEFESPDEIFTEYAYFSSCSESWLNHAKIYSYSMTDKLKLNSDSLVVEIASNDGYLLQYFKEQGINVLGIEPAKNVAEIAIGKGIPTVTNFFGKEFASELAQEGKKAELLIGNNVLAHVPNINDFVAGLKEILLPHGVITMEFPHLLRLIEENQFDTIYHEHFSYLSLFTVREIFSKYGLTIYDVDELPTHGGSLRIYAKHSDNSLLPILTKVDNLLAEEKAKGINDLALYKKFEEQVKETKRKLLKFLIELKAEGKTIVGYGAPAKGNTLLNYCGIRTDFLDFTVDINQYKQGMYLPGTHIPIKSPEEIKQAKPDYVLILPWNIKEEIMEQISYIKDWGGKFIIPIPDVVVR